MKKITVIIVIALVPTLLFAQVIKMRKDIPVSEKNIKKEKPILVMSSAKVKMKQPLKITSHVDGQDAAGSVQILGTGEPGKTVNVTLYAYIEVSAKKKEGIWGIFKNIVLPPGGFDAINEGLLRNVPGTKIMDTYYKSFSAKIDNNGKWYIPAFTSFPNDLDWINKYYKKYYVMPFAWVVSATSDFDPNYEKQEKNYVSIRLGCANGN